MTWIAASIVLAGILLLSVLSLIAYISPSAVSSTPRPSFPSERVYACIPPASSDNASSSSSSSSNPLPDLVDTPRNDQGTVQLSVIVPAYNEAERLPGMLHEALTYLEAAYASSSYEVVVVDDGSTDATSRGALALAEQHRGKGGDSVRVVTLKRNRGKGGAVRHGMLHARGRRILFVDADGASRFEDLKLLEQEMDTLCGGSANIGEGSGMGNGHAQGGKDDGETRAIVLGSRAHMVSTEAVVKRSALRNLLMRSFHIYLSVLGIRHIADTQCGFKLFTRSAASAIFPSMHVEGWIFDIEILVIALLLGDVRTKEVPIRWNEVHGSKMDLVWDSLRMATDLVVIRASYAIGRWKVKDVVADRARLAEPEGPDGAPS